MLEIRGVTKRFATDGRLVAALEKVDLDVADGQFVSLVGSSGCGKTTLLKIVDGLVPASGGAVRLDGRELHGVSREVAFVFQDINLLPWRSVVQNVELGLMARGMAAAERRRRAMDALVMVGLEHVATVPPYTLSGGMQQRVGVARAIAVEPKVLLMDEPFGHLDNLTREALQAELSKLWRRIGMTVLFVTHDVDEAIFLSDRIAVMRSSPGRVIDVLDVDLPHPRWTYEVHDDARAIRLRARIRELLGRGEEAA